MNPLRIDSSNQVNYSDLVQDLTNNMTELALKSLNKIFLKPVDYVRKAIKYTKMKKSFKEQGLSDKVIKKSTLEELKSLNKKIGFIDNKTDLVEIINSIGSIKTFFDSAESFIEISKKRENPHTFENYQKNLSKLNPHRREDVAKISIKALEVIKKNINETKKDIAFDLTEDHPPFIIDKKNRIFFIERNLAEGTERYIYQGLEIDEFSNRYVFVRFKAVNIEEIQKEIKLQNELHGIKHLMPPYEVLVKAENSDIFFGIQQKADDDGTQIYHKSTEQILDNLIQVGVGLAGMHKKGFIHSDFKPANFLIHDDKAYVSDFGATLKIKEGEEYVDRRGGTLMYMAPEMMHKKVVSRLSDSFSYGVSILEIIAQKNGINNIKTILNRFNKGNGFYQLDQKQIEASIKFLKDQVKKPASDRLTAQLAMLDTVEKLMQVDEKKRISCEAAVVQLKEVLNKYRQDQNFKITNH